MRAARRREPYENVARGRPRFLHLYESDTEDVEHAFQRMTPATLARLPDRDARRDWRAHPDPLGRDEQPV